MHVDTSVIEVLKEVMESEFDILLETFIEDSQERLDQLKLAFAAGEVDAFRRAAHSFKGSSGNLGAHHLSSLCMQAERLAEKGNIGGAELLLNEIVAEYAAVAVEINSYRE